MNGDPKFLTSKDGRIVAYFDMNDYSKARNEEPELFEWLDYPEKYVEEFLK